MEWNTYFTQCTTAEDGILCCSQSDDVKSKFSPEAQNNLFEIEDGSWWFQYRAKVIYHMVRKFFRSEKLIFDVGGGNGYAARMLEKSGGQEGYRVALLEPSFSACQNAKRRGVQNVICGTLDQETTIDNSIDQFLLLDVLEHIEDDLTFLQTMYCKLAPGGRIILTVPAFQQLWSSEDDAVGHYRRYRRQQLESIVKGSGFQVLCCTYFFEFLFLPILLLRVGLEKIGMLKRVENRTAEEKRRITEKQFKERKGIVGLILSMLEGFELRRLEKGGKIRFGSSLLCVLQK